MDRSTPVTLKLLVLILDLPPDAPAAPPCPVPDPPALIVPDSLRSVRVSAPAAADTFFRPETFATSEEGRVPSPPAVSTLRLKLVPADGLLPGIASAEPEAGGAARPRCAASWVTVTSVPTP